MHGLILGGMNSLGILLHPALINSERDQQKQVSGSL